MGLRCLITAAATGLSMSLLCDLLGLHPQFFVDHPWASVWVFVFAVVQLFLWLVLIRCLSGRLAPLPEADQERDRLCSSADEVPPLPRATEKRSPEV
jgi:hypothetical protein